MSIQPIPNYSLNGKVALITGGSRGIGKAIALTFAQAGAYVVICGRNQLVLEKAAEEIAEIDGHFLTVKADISLKSDVDYLLRRTLQEFGTIDILMNNAGITLSAPLLELTEYDWNMVMNTNLKGYYLCSQAAGRVMVEKRGGNIINMASITARRASPRVGVYCISKAGVVMLTQVLAVELSQYNIRVNAIAPGNVKVVFTPRQREMWGSEEQINEGIAEGVPLGRGAERQEVANVALFLASDASSYITGQTIFVDGGMLA